MKPVKPDLVAAAAVGIISLDAEACIVSANAAALRLLGCIESDLIGRGAHECLNAGKPEANCELEAAVRAGRPLQFQDDTFRTRDGADLPVWWAINPLRSRRGGGQAGAVLVFGDGTVQRAQAVAAAAEREQGRVDLERARQSIADLEWAAAISQALSSTLDEEQVVQRLARLTVGRLADIAVGSLTAENAVVRRVGGAVAEGVAVDLDEVLTRPEVALEFEPWSRTYELVTSGQVVELTPDQIDDPQFLSPQSRAMVAALGVTRLLTVPLIARGHAVGALALMRLAGSPPFDDTDKIAAADVCLRAALAVDNARLYRAQLEIATRLQHSLLPEARGGSAVRTAVRYLPARDRFDIGGDWYDLFELSDADGKIALVIGDVAGHDLTAATIMAALRNLLRGVSVVSDDSPAHVLRSVDDSLETFAIPGTATVLLAHVTPVEGGWRLRWSNAGHMPPLLLDPDGGIELLDEVHGSLLGTGMGVNRSDAERVLPNGSTLVLYTDGLVETREETIDAGLARLRANAAGLTAPLDEPDAVADELLARNHASVEDDTAMLVCHLP